MKGVKLLVLFTIGTVFCSLATAQLKLPGITEPSIQTELDKVVKDYFNHFMNIRGEEISQNPQSTEYSSSIKLNGAEQCSVTKYTSARNDVWSWQALMLTTEEFESAKKKFKSLYGQLNNLSISFDNEPACSFQAPFETPTEEKKFASVIFLAQTKNETLIPLRIELSLEYKLVAWEIRILVYGKEREDNEQGKTRGD